MSDEMREIDFAQAVRDTEGSNWENNAARDEIMEHDAAQRTRISALESERDAALDRAREEALLNIGARMEREGLSAQLAAALQRAEDLQRSAADWQGQARLYAQNADYWRERADAWQEGARRYAQNADYWQARAEAAEASVAVLADVLSDNIDESECRLDHHGYCQAHAYLHKGTCPVARAKQALASLPTAAAALRAKAGLAGEAAILFGTQSEGRIFAAHSDQWLGRVEAWLARYRAATAPADGGGQG